ncbi:MAG: agmatinase [Euryarchaeota archaeon]|jgi:agmatinase|nr:agmatinase [Euryarchaeota archaeon]
MSVSEEFEEGAFLGIRGCRTSFAADFAVLSIPYELTTSYGQGTENGPAAAISASAQVELYDELLTNELPCGAKIFTAPPWDGEGDNLKEQQKGISTYVGSNVEGGAFPIIFGGEHGILPAVLSGVKNHELLLGDLSKLTLVQIDAHADLRDELGGEPMSHACAARRSLDLGVGKLMQLGVRAYCREEKEFIDLDSRVTTWFARDVLSLANSSEKWEGWLTALQSIEGPVWLTIDVDGLDPCYVPSTGTPVPGGLSFWQVIETIEKLFSSQSALVLGVDINEIVPDQNNHITEFTAAMLAKKVVAAHIANSLTPDTEADVNEA